MSVTEAKNEIAWLDAIDAIKAAGVSDEVIQDITNGRAAMSMINTTAAMLHGSADTSQAKNYVTLNLNGMRAPFERLTVEIVRPKAYSSSELAAEYAKYLDQIIAVIEFAPDIGYARAATSHLKEEIARLSNGHGSVTDAEGNPT